MNNNPRLPLLSLRLSGAVSPLAVVDLARCAEEAGFAALWLAENPFERGALPAAAAAAVATSRLEIGVGVVNPYNRHPTLIAMEFAALDELSRGRALLGIGAGIGAAIGRIGHSWDHPTSAVEDAIRVVRALLRGEEVDYRGRVFRVDGVRLGFRPPRPQMPVLMAAVGDKSLRLCGRVADGLVISNLLPLAYTERAVGIVCDTARGLGRAPDRVVQYVPCAVRRRRAEAREIAKRGLGALLVRFWHNAEGRPARRAAIFGGSGIGAEEFAACVERLARGEAAEAVLDDRFVEAFAIAGTVEDCLARAASYRRAGVTELALGFLGPEPERDIATLGRAWR